MKILVLQGPNINMLGKRKAEHYGSVTMEEIHKKMSQKASELGCELTFFQSNHEGAMIDYIQSNSDRVQGIIINAGALTHYGLSMRDALADAGLPTVEVHLSNIHSREEFRRLSVVAALAVGQIAGLGWRGYLYALEYLAARLREGSDS